MTVEAAVNRLLDVSSRRGLQRVIVSGPARVPVMVSSAVILTPHTATLPVPPKKHTRCPHCGAVK